MTRKHLTPTRLGAVLAVAAGVLLGAVFGQPGSGRAATEAVPKNKTLPAINGTVSVGQTLTATTGAWTGSPTSFAYLWSRCDTGGNGCATIRRATAKIYTVVGADVGHTLRVAVTAKNADGRSQPAVSAPTAIVAPGGCPTGTGAMQIAQVTPPARLAVGTYSVSPAVTRKTQTINIHVLITACGGRPVQGAVVFAVPIPFNQFKGAAVTTGSDGTVTISESRQRGFPAARRQHLLAVFIRATKPGEPATAGVSTGRVVSFHISG